MDASLVSSDFMSDVTLFIPACAASLLSQLQDGGDASITSSCASVENRSWTVPQNSATEKHVKLLCSIPEDVVDDLMELLLFVVKSNPKSLSFSSLAPVLDLIMYFMR
jgi:hypothetical protein